MEHSKTDGVDGTAADETVDFGIDGVRYEVDLSSANAAILRGVIAQWAERGRRVDRRRVRHLVPADPWRRYVSSGERVAIRKWCEDNGHEVGGRGPLPFHLVDAFRAANSPARQVDTRMLRTSEA